MQTPSQQEPTSTPSPSPSNVNDDVPWWLKYAGRGTGTVGSVVAIILGAWNCVSLSPVCIVAGIYLMLVGFFVCIVEAPCICMFLDFVQSISNYFDSKPQWLKGALYICISIPDVLLCGGLTTFFGSALIFTTGVIYGLMALGKKASRDEMAANVKPLDTMKTTLVDAEQPPAVIS